MFRNISRKFTVAVAFTAFVLPVGAAIAQSTSSAPAVVTGTNPPPQVVTGTNPPPQVVTGTNPPPQTIMTILLATLPSA
ncbi:MAG: hypothetical protein M3Y72_26685 [Acidobacteriota bacterium]|nr:hypothetical protein [Acidobacteriota bacterium]